MIRKDNIGQWFFWGFALLAVPLVLLSPLDDTFRKNIKPLTFLLSQVCGMLGFSLFAMSFLLSSRIKWMEKYFGGLDTMYHTHHTMAKFAYVFMLVHPVLMAFRWRPDGIGQVVTFLLPTHDKLAIDLGSIAVIGVTILLLFTFFIRIAYDKWKRLHKLMGIFFILSMLHIFLLKDDLYEFAPLLIYVIILSVLGTSAYVYKTLLFDVIKRKYQYTVTNVNKLSDRVMEIALKASGEEAPFIPGQYYFFSFIAPQFTKESHPFTICNVKEEKEIKIIVKSLGDYTNNLYNKIEPGVEAKLEGPYGTFYYRTGKKEQVWIGGGVGMAPFISWARELKEKPYPGLKADLYYCVDTRDDAVHQNVFDELESKDFHVHLVCVDETGFLKADHIKELDGRDIYICGPKGMRRSLLKGFDKLKVKRERIQYEDFDFV